jgi:hypothetical protein
MGLGKNVSADFPSQGGVMGIGYELNEAAAVPYPNLVDRMQKNGLIATQLYSLWLNGYNSATGSILFGGIDTEKYYGTLYSMNLAPNSRGNYSEFSVRLTSISMNPTVEFAIPVTNSSFSETVILESSTTLIFLPPPVVEIIYSSFDVQIDTSNRIPYVNCDAGNSSYLSFGFETGATINVPYSIIMRKYSGAPTITLPFSNVCTLSIRSGAGDQ